ncbi:MAG TPA: hypothetical protein VFT47_06335 [Vicinamibacterales bacterium]|nr:hypothetical protein [Vicinamibacterales bacterium]
MNLDFGLEPLFSWYVVLLCLSGVVMVVLAAIKAGGQSVGSRALSAVAGLGFLGYGIYLGFIFDGGSYLMFFQAFILPALLVVNFVRSLFTNHQAEPQPQPQPYAGGATQPYAGVPTQPYPGGPAQPQPYPAGSAQPQPYQAGSAQPQPFAGGPTQPYPAQPQPQAYPAQPQAYPAGPAQPGPTQPN